MFEAQKLKWFYRWGSRLRQLGLSRLAARCLEHALVYVPAQNAPAGIAHQLGICYASLHDLEPALSAFDAAEQASNGDLGYRARLDRDRSRAYLRCGKTKKALDLANSSNTALLNQYAQDRSGATMCEALMSQAYYARVLLALPGMHNHDSALRTFSRVNDELRCLGHRHYELHNLRWLIKAELRHYRSWRRRSRAIKHTARFVYLAAWCLIDTIRH